MWDFGDGSGITTPTATVSHNYTASGAYTVTLALINAAGCSTATANNLQNVLPKAEVDFTAQQTCTSAPAQFTTAIISGQPAGLQYQWDFGDNAATPAGNKSNEMNPQHLYTAPGSYTVILTARNPAGCESTSSKTITVSGPPNAAFELATATLCTDAPATIRNLSTISGTGAITRIEVYFDALNAPNDKLSFNNPTNGQEISFSYPAMSGLPSRPVSIRLVAYSGTTCSSEKTAIYTLYAAPKLFFTDLPALCVKDQPVALGATVSNGVTGTDSYSGNGITQAGFFDPQLAGPGTHLVTYHFRSFAGCESSTSIQVEVRPEIKISGDYTFTFSQAPVKLALVYEGSPTSYTWLPANGLSDPGSPYPFASPAVTTTYIVTASNGICEQSQQITVNVAPELEISNSFTPNNDGINDYFTIKNLDAWPGATVSIFNRYGTLVYESRRQYNPWDGRYNGREMPAGVYYYVILIPNAQKKQSGYITLIR